MPRNGLSIYHNSRNAAKLSREEAADLLHISARQLTRYESTDPSEMTTPPDDVVAIMMEVYNDNYLGYLHLMQSPVARKLLPGADVRQLDMLHTIVLLGHKCTHFTNHVFDLQAAAMDDQIDPNEMPLWEDAQSDVNALLAAAFSMKFIRRKEE